MRHEVSGTDLATLAGEANVTSGAIAMRLARARSNLRLEFLLAFRRMELPTNHCRPVLLAFAVGDRRRQAQLDADEHVRTCSACAQLVGPMTQRDRRIAGWLLIPVAEGLRRGVAGAAQPSGARGVGGVDPRRHRRPCRRRPLTGRRGSPGHGGDRGRHGDRSACRTRREHDRGPDTVRRSRLGRAFGRSHAHPSANGAVPSASVANDARPSASVANSARPSANVAAPAPASPTAPAPAPTSPAPPGTSPATEPPCPAPAPLDEMNLADALGCPFAESAVTVTAVSGDGFQAVTTAQLPVSVDVSGGLGLPVTLVPGLRLAITGTVTSESAVVATDMRPAG